MNIVKTLIIWVIIFFTHTNVNAQCPPSSEVLINNFLDPYCYDESPVNLNQYIEPQYQGGIFIGSGVNGTFYTPADGTVGSVGTITYTINVNGNSCPYTLNYLVQSTDVPVLTLNQPLESSYCESDSFISLNATSSLGGVSVQLNGEFLTIPIYDPAMQVNNGVDTIVYGYGLSCYKYDTFYVETFTMPVFTLPDTLFTDDLPTQVSVTPQGGTFNFPAGLSVNNNVIDPSTSTPGSYTITYELTPSCTETFTIEIVEAETPEPEIPEEIIEVFVPNIFTPNNDNVNDEVLIEGRNIINAYIKIFNRWGEKVFESDDKNIGWDGTYKDREQPSGVYYYYLTAAMNDSTYINKKGDITLIR